MSRRNKSNNEFTNPLLTHYNLDKFYHRTAILKSLKRALPNLKGRLVDIGCGKMPYKIFISERSEITEYLGLDIETAIVYDEKVKADYTWDGTTMPFSDNSFDSALATEVLEHSPNPTALLKETIRVLRPGGMLFFTVPFLWNLHEVPHDEYRYTPFSLERHLKEAGFNNINIVPLGGWHASLAQMLGLWVRRSPIHPKAKKILSYLLIPLYRLLISMDQSYEIKEGQMITGLSGVAYK